MSVKALEFKAPQRALRVGFLLVGAMVRAVSKLRPKLRRRRASNQDSRVDETFPMGPPISSEYEPLPPAPSAEAEEVGRSIRN